MFCHLHTTGTETDIDLNKIRKSREETNELKQSVSTQASQIGELQRKMEQCVNEKEAMKQARNDAMSELKKLKERASQLEKEAKTSAQAAQHAERRLAEHENEVENMRSFFMMNIAGRDCHIEKLGEKKTALEKQNASLCKQLSGMKKRLEMTDKVSQGQMQHSNDETEKLKKDKATLDGQLALMAARFCFARSLVIFLLYLISAIFFYSSSMFWILSVFVIVLLLWKMRLLHRLSIYLKICWTKIRFSSEHTRL